MNAPHNDRFSANQLKQQIDEISDSISEYSTDEKARFESTLKGSMKSIDEQIEKLKIRSASLKDEASKEVDRLALKLQTERDVFEAKLKATQTQSGNAWLELKDGLQSAWKDLAESAEDAVSAFQESKSD